MSPVSREDFDNLGTDKPERASVPTVSLLEELEKEAYSTSEVQGMLGVSYSAAYSRLTRLENSGLVMRRYEGKTSYWLAVEGATERYQESQEEEE